LPCHALIVPPTLALNSSKLCSPSGSVITISGWFGIEQFLPHDADFPWGINSDSHAVALQPQNANLDVAADDD
jgi:hypothetical protein